MTRFFLIPEFLRAQIFHREELSDIIKSIAGVSKSWSDRTWSNWIEVNRIWSIFFRSDSTRFLLNSDPMKLDPIRFKKSSIRSSSILSRFWNLRSDQARSDQVLKILDPIKFDPTRFIKTVCRPLVYRVHSINYGPW